MKATYKQDHADSDAFLGAQTQRMEEKQKYLFILNSTNIDEVLYPMVGTAHTAGHFLVHILHCVLTGKLLTPRMSHLETCFQKG